MTDELTWDELDTAPPWKQQPPCEVCHEQHAGYEAAHI